MKSVLILCSIIFLCHASFSQELDKEQAKALTESKNLTWEANESLSENNFVEAEADYRRAISKSNENSAAPYNLGNAYYNTENYSEAFGRYKQAGELAMEKADKHHAYHNMGNVFMKRKEYEKAVEAYKEALRNNPTDEETRYNYALAKEMLKKQQNEQQNDQNEDDKEQNEEKNKGDNGDQEEKDDSENKKNEEKEENKEGDGEEKKEETENQGQGEDKEENSKQEQQPRPNQLSPQQIKNLLEAMQNEEKKVQEKIDAQKMKGLKVKTEKDW